MMVVRAVLVTVAALLVSSVALAAMKITGFAITGSGTTSMTYLFSKWTQGFKSETGLAVNYQHHNSSIGLTHLRTDLVHFAATDIALTSEELERLGMIQFPVAIGAIVPVVNVRGVGPGELKLTSQVLADIFLGKIRSWNDPAIQELNPDIKLPSQPVFIAQRNDGAGATYNFTDYLARVSDEWKETVGVGITVEWPRRAQVLGAKGDHGVVNFMRRTPGSIGYVSFGHVWEHNLSYVQLQNHDGNFVTPSVQAIQHAAANADWTDSPGSDVFLNNRPGAESWPINAVTYILMHKEPTDLEGAETALRFFTWSLDHGDQLAHETQFVPVPDDVVERVRQTWTGVERPDGVALYPLN